MLALDATEYHTVNVTVYVAPGDYYFFNCFGKFVEPKACELKSPAIDWCYELSTTLPQTYTKRDNIHYTFVNMCDSDRLAEIVSPTSYSILESPDSILNYVPADYTRLCTNPSGAIKFDPVFNIMDPYFNFNITGSMTF